VGLAAPNNTGTVGLGAMTDDQTIVYYGATRVCEACETEFSAFDEYRRVEMSRAGDTFSGPEYFICDNCTKRLLEGIEGEHPGMKDLTL
jgi:hypothetical protein